MKNHPQSVYVHVPFCRHRCGYCNFTLITGRDDLVGDYLEALDREMALTLAEPRSVETIFLGGGTPSYLKGADLDRLLGIINHWLPCGAEGEFSCEVNPLDCTPDQLERLKSGGVNRISLGGQSFSDSKLKTLERDHSGAELTEAVARCAGQFEKVSLDLIFAAPGETPEQWQNDLKRALKVPIQHLSTYGLTIERGAAFYGRLAKQEIAEVDCDTQLEMYEQAIDLLAANRWEHYEVSNFAQPGFRCRHNEAYWVGDPWWAFGPGAASYLHSPVSEPSESAPLMVRSVNHRSTTTYIHRMLTGQSPRSEQIILSPEEQLRERLVFGLRRLQGVDLSLLERWWGAPVDAYFEPYMQRYVELGFLERLESTLRLTRKGLVISDSLWPDLLG